MRVSSRLLRKLRFAYRVRRFNSVPAFHHERTPDETASMFLMHFNTGKYWPVSVDTIRTPACQAAPVMVVYYNNETRATEGGAQCNLPDCILVPLPAKYVSQSSFFLLDFTPKPLPGKRSEPHDLCYRLSVPPSPENLSRKVSRICPWIMEKAIYSYRVLSSPGGIAQNNAIWS